MTGQQQSDQTHPSGSAADACVCLASCCRDKPRLVSDGEKMALLYNIACCHSQLQDARSGLVALAGMRLRQHQAY